MPRKIRVSALVLIVLVLATPAAGTVTDKRKQIHDKIGSLQGKVSHARHQKAALTSQISKITGRIRFLHSQIGDQTKKLDVLQAQLARHERILNLLNARYTVETQLL